MRNIDYGKQGEKIAGGYLKKSGFKILETNYTTGIGEIDIVAYKGGVTVFIEVKTRHSQNYGLPREAVTVHKQKKYSMVAMQYIKQHSLFNSAVRFDVIEVLEGELTHIENAFGFIR